MADDPTKEAIGAYFAWHLQRDPSWDRAVAAARKKWPGQDPALFEQGREIAETMEEAVTRYGGLSATDRLIDAFGNNQPTTTKVGVRFLVWVEESPGVLVQKSIAFEAYVGQTVALLDERARFEAEAIVRKGTYMKLASREQVIAETGDPEAHTITILSILTGPLPNKIP
jgi:hypothetical protein